MIDDEELRWKRLRPVWIGGIAGLVAGAILFILSVAWPLEVSKAFAPAHDIFGDLKLLDLRKLPFLLPVFGVMFGLLIKMYRDAVVKRHRRGAVPPADDSLRR